MREYIVDNRNLNIPGIILLSHGPLALGLLKSGQLIFGEHIENLAALTLEEGDDVNIFRKRAFEIYDLFPEGTIFMVDIFGGSPCNQILLEIQETKKNIPIITGMNLPMLIQAVMGRMMNEPDWMDESIQEGRKAIYEVDVLKFLEDDEED